MPSNLFLSSKTDSAEPIFINYNPKIFAHADEYIQEAKKIKKLAIESLTKLNL